MKYTLLFPILVTSAYGFTSLRRNGKVFSNNSRFTLQAAEKNAPSESYDGNNLSREKFLGAAVLFGSAGIFPNQPALADSSGEGGRPGTLDIDNFLRTGQEATPMGVSSQAGKSKPITGVYLRDGTEVDRDTRTGNVLAEIVLGEKADLSAILVTFSSPWPLAKGTVFDVETRDAKTGDSAFLSVTEKTGGRGIQDIPSLFFLEQLFAPTGRFSFYGSPTDLKIKKSMLDGNRRIIEFSFSQLSQSTNAEIPRQAIMVASKPDNTDQAVVLVASSTATRWKKGTEKDIREIISSFNASPSPKSALKVRKKEIFSNVEG